MLLFRWAFKMYDTDNSGKIEMKEMVNVMKVNINLKETVL